MNKTPYPISHRPNLIRRWIKVGLVSLCLVGLLSCAVAPPRDKQVVIEKPPSKPNNLCSVFKEKPHWIASAQKSYAKWGIPVELMMAVMFYESSFRANARPLDKQGNRISSAYGYAQAIDGTWRQFQRENNLPRTRRDDFGDAIYFIGWYASKSIAKNKDLSPYDITSLYVFYHDGWGALPEDGSRDIKRHVLEVAGKVYKRTLIYHRQLKDCPAGRQIYEASEQGARLYNTNRVPGRKSSSGGQWF